MRVNIAVQLSVLTLIAGSAVAIDAPKTAAAQAAAETTRAGPNEVRTLQWEELMPPDERDRPFGGSPRMGHLFGDESGPAALQEGSTAVNKTLDGALIRLPGFVVPLSVDKKQLVSQFLLVPYFGACIHVPPPPPNQIVYVAPDKPIHLDMVYDAVWVTGKLTAQQAATELATASYSLAATKVEKYEER